MTFPKGTYDLNNKIRHRKLIWFHKIEIQLICYKTNHRITFYGVQSTMETNNITKVGISPLGG
jgi:hypothetical protein